MRYDLVIFDMDGTLTCDDDLLNFQRIRDEIGLPGTGPLLEQIHALPVDQRPRALDILHRHEHNAAENCRLQPGATELLATLYSHHVKTALLTRNSPACTATVLRRHRISFDHVATREDLPHKPHPDSILNITRRLGVAPARALMVGDFVWDLLAAERARVDSALLCPGERPSFADQATYVIRELSALAPLVVAAAS